MRFCEPWLVAVATIARLGAAADTMQLGWTTDLVSWEGYTGGGVFGPDGPWQAISAFVGEPSDDYRYGTPVPLWPTSYDTTEIPTVQAGGNYSVNDSSSAVDTGVETGGSSITYPAAFNLSADGANYFDILTLPRGMDGDTEKTNASINAMDEHQRVFPNGKKSNETVGVLGLGPNRERNRPDDVGSDEWASILEQLKKDKKIGSASFSLHVGSVPLEQSGSLVLGGYDRNRVVGKAGVFSLPRNPGYAGMPFMALHDVVLGVETGSSPFESDDHISVYAGLGKDEVGEQGARLTSQVGGPSGSALILPNPATPYIYLPPGTCEEAAKHLPVTLDKNLGLYLWDTSDPEFRRIVDSPAYLGFVFADRDDANVTVKVPFRLLNLTLTTPLADEPTAYFPCKTDESLYGWWQLGRAFLQGAFWAVDFDANTTYLAQAPGPGMGGSVIKAMGEGGEAPEGAESELEASWADSWTVLSEERGQSLSGGAIAGIVVGCVVFLVAIAAAVVLFRRRKKKNTVEETPEEPPAEKAWVSRWKGAEAQGTPVQEMDAPAAMHEAPGKDMAHEISGNAIVAELPASPVR